MILHAQMSRRRALASLGAAGLIAGGPVRMAHAATAGSRNFVFVILRGAADGLSIAAPVAEPALRVQRALLADAAAGGTRLDGTFTLHPSLTAVGRRFAAGQANVLHAVASSYRDRSHFDAQNILETGGIAAYAEHVGWMNRLVGLLSGPEARALAVGAVIPPVLRGPQPVTSYAPSILPDAQSDLIDRVGRLYAGDAQLHQLFAMALSTQAMAADAGADAPAGGPGRGRNGAAIGMLAASLMRPADGGTGGAHLVSIELEGWDTHNNQQGRLAIQLGQLDALVEALATGLGPAWADTMVLVATEFGRTVAVNGTGGTDHGTGSAALLLGGGLTGGGRVLADWPGIRSQDLYEGRDLRPTMALEAVISGAVAGHYGLDPALTARTLYPAHAGLQPMRDLV